MNYLAVLVSGNGTNLQAFIDAIEAGNLADTQISVVVSNRKAAYALKRAEKHGIPTIYHPLRPYRKAGQERREYDADLATKLAQYPVDLIILAGWMHIFTMSFLKHYSGRVLNIHPALPDTFPGTHVIERAYQAFQEGEIGCTGVMVHRVPDEGVDVGPVVLQRVVPIYAQDTLGGLEQRIHEIEHELYVQAVAQVLGVSILPKE